MSVISTEQFEEYVSFCDADDLRSAEYCVCAAAETVGAEIARGAVAIVVLVTDVAKARRWIGRVPENVFLIPLGRARPVIDVTGVIKQVSRSTGRTKK